MAEKKKKSILPKNDPLKKKKKKTTSKDLPGKGLVKKAGKAIESRKKLLKSI